MCVGSAQGCRVTNEIVVPFCLHYCRGCAPVARACTHVCVCVCVYERASGRTPRYKEPASFGSWTCVTHTDCNSV